MAAHLPQRRVVRSTYFLAKSPQVFRWFSTMIVEWQQFRNTEIISPFVLGTAKVSVDRGQFLDLNLIALPCDLSTHELIFNVLINNTLIADEIAVCRLARSDYLHHCFIESCVNWHCKHRCDNNDIDWLLKFVLENKEHSTMHAVRWNVTWTMGE